MLLAYCKHTVVPISAEKHKKSLTKHLYHLKTTHKALLGLIKIYSTVYHRENKMSSSFPHPLSYCSSTRKKEKSHLDLCSLLHEAASFLAVSLILFWLLSFKIVLNLSRFTRPAVISKHQCLSFTWNKSWFLAPYWKSIHLNPLKLGRAGSGYLYIDVWPFFSICSVKIVLGCFLQELGIPGKDATSFSWNRIPLLLHLDVKCLSVEDLGAHHKI